MRMEIANLVGEHLRDGSYERAELAAKLGYKSPAQLSKWLSGKVLIPPEKLALLADMLGLPIASFFPARLRGRGWHEKMASAVQRRDYPAALSILVELMPSKQQEE